MWVPVRRAGLLPNRFGKSLRLYGPLRGRKLVLWQYVKIVSLTPECAMMRESRMRVSQNGRVVIPASFRKALGIEVGDEVLLRIQDDELRITTQQRRIQRAQRRAQRYLKPGTSLVGELLAERREAAKHE